MSELSDLARSVVDPVMANAGFRRRGGLGYELEGNGGLVIVSLKNYQATDLSFIVSWGVFPPVLLEFYRDTRPGRPLRALDGLVASGLIAPRAASLFHDSDYGSSDLWVRRPGHEQEFAEVVSSEFAERAAPMWKRLLADPRRLPTAVQDEPLVWHNNCQLMRYQIWLPFVIEVDSGVPEEVLARLDVQPVDARFELYRWLRARLVARIDSPDSSRPEIRGDRTAPGIGSIPLRRLAIDPWASIVVLNEDAYPPLLDAYRDDLNDTQNLNHGWRVLSFSGTTLAEDAEELTPALAARTGTPVLTAMVIDSAALLVTGTHGDHHWEAVVPLPADPDMANAGLTGVSAAQALLSWAADAGLNADAALTNMATTTHTDGFGAMWAFHTLLTAFGLAPAT